MAKQETGATPAGDASSTPVENVQAATEVVQAMTEPLQEAPPPPRREPPVKVKGLETGKAPPVKSAREEMYEQMVRSRVEKVAADEGLAVEDLDVDIASIEAENARRALDEPEPEPEKPAAVEKPAEPAKPETQLIDDPTKFMVKLKVDGQEIVMPLADVVRIQQKEQAANKRLEEATRTLQEARAQPAPTKPEPEQRPEDWEATKSEFITALYSGDEKKTAAAIDKIFAVGAQKATPTPAIDVTAAVQQELKKSAVESALEKFRSDYSDIVSDPYLPMIADKFLADELQGAPLEALPKGEIPKVLDRAGKATRDWVASRAPKSNATTEPTTRTERTARKAMIDEIPSVTAGSGSVQERPETRESVLDAMRKARGLAI